MYEHYLIYGHLKFFGGVIGIRKKELLFNQWIELLINQKTP